MAQSTISARIDSKDKSDFDRFCNNVGLSASTAINLFVKAVLRENRISFDIAASPDPFYSTANQEYVLKSVKELRDGKRTATRKRNNLYLWPGSKGWMRAIKRTFNLQRRKSQI